MRICWDNLEKLRYNKKIDKWRDRSHSYRYIDACKICDEPFLSLIFNEGYYCSNECLLKSKVGGHLSEETRRKIGKIQKGNKNCLGKHHSDETKRKMSRMKKGKYQGEKHPMWKGGVSNKNIPLYNTYAHQISWCESVRQDPNDENILQVKCTYCEKWYGPKTTEVQCRINALNGKMRGEHHLYCSNKCKQSCTIFNQRKYPKDKKPTYGRDSQYEWSEMVKERDDYKCTNCGSTKNLIAHHKEGIRWEPLESADIDMGITLCKKCERKVHKIEGCTYYDMRCE